MNTTKSYALAFGLPLDVAIARIEASAKELQHSAKKVAAGNSQSFGSKISEAVKRKLRSRNPAFATNANANEESFGEKITRAVKAKMNDRSRK
jgi:hypothetical protein